MSESPTTIPVARGAESGEHQMEAHLRDLMEWEKKEADACRKNMYDLLDGCDFDNRRDEIVQDFVHRCKGRFIYLESIKESKQQPYTTGLSLGCARAGDLGEQEVYCHTCKSRRFSVGQIAGTEIADLPICFSLDVPLAKLRVVSDSPGINDATLLLPIMPNWKYKLDDQAFYVQEKLHNPAGLTIADVYRGIQAIARSRVDEPMMNACLGYIRGYIAESLISRPDTYVLSRPRNRANLIWDVKTAGQDHSRIERLVDIPYYRSSMPFGIRVFVSQDEQVFVEVRWEGEVWTEGSWEYHDA